MMTNRRNFTKGITLGASGAVLMPLLRQMEAHAAGRSDGFPKRFVFVIKSSGITPAAIRPEGIDIGDDDNLSISNLPIISSHQRYDRLILSKRR